MSKIVHPYSHRLGIIRDWKSRWFGMDKKLREYLKGDVLVREYLEKKLRGMYVSSIEIERSEKNMRIIIKTSRPGMIIGRSGDGANALKKDILAFMKKHAIAVPQDLKIDIMDVPEPESNAQIVAHVIAEALEKRMPFRPVMKQTGEKVMAVRGVKGVKLYMTGRLGGADMARSEELKLGGIPLQFMRADIDYATDKAHMTYGDIGIKVWIYKGDSLENEMRNK